MGRVYNNYPIPMYKMREYSDGIRIAGGIVMRPAPYLPVLQTRSTQDGNYLIEKGIVIEKGSFVTFDQFGYVVPAFIGDGALSYSAIDAAFGTFDIDSFSGKVSDAVVTGGKSSTKKLGTTADADVKIGMPVGIQMFDVFQWDMNKDPWYQVQPQLTIVADRMILYALDADHEALPYTPGTILTLNQSGFPVPLDLTPADAEDLAQGLQYGIGRLVRVIDVNGIDQEFTGGLEYVKYPPDVVLPGEPTKGLWDGIDLTTKKGLLIQLWF